MSLIAEMAQRALGLSRVRKDAKATLLLAEDSVAGSVSYKFDHAFTARYEFNKRYFDCSTGAGNSIILSAKNETSLRLGPFMDDMLIELAARHVEIEAAKNGQTAALVLKDCGLNESECAAAVL
ncbi:MAG: hypothetical protein Q7U28_09320 [Aquabacterium sp.]|nr:hypothetical protein [Aquabacterium sp.]